MFLLWPFEFEARLLLGIERERRSDVRIEKEVLGAHRGFGRLIVVRDRVSVEQWHRTSATQSDRKINQLTHGIDSRASIQIFVFLRPQAHRGLSATCSSSHANAITLTLQI